MKNSKEILDNAYNFINVYGAGEISTSLNGRYNNEDCIITLKGSGNHSFRTKGFDYEIGQVITNTKETLLVLKCYNTIFEQSYLITISTNELVF